MPDFVLHDWLQNWCFSAVAVIIPTSALDFFYDM